MVRDGKARPRARFKIGARGSHPLGACVPPIRGPVDARCACTAAVIPSWRLQSPELHLSGLEALCIKVHAFLGSGMRACVTPPYWLVVALLSVYPLCVIGESRGEVSKLPLTCKQRLDSILDEYYSLNSTGYDGNNKYHVQCVGQCRADCRKTIESALEVETTSLCPDAKQIRTCFRVSPYAKRSPHPFRPPIL